MGRLFAVTLEGRIYSCKHCGTHLALSDDVVSKVFMLFSYSFVVVVVVFSFCGMNLIGFLDAVLEFGSS